MNSDLNKQGQIVQVTFSRKIKPYHSQTLVLIHVIWVFQIHLNKLSSQHFLYTIRNEAEIHKSYNVTVLKRLG